MTRKMRIIKSSKVVKDLIGYYRNIACTFFKNLPNSLTGNGGTILGELTSDCMGCLKRYQSWGVIGDLQPNPTANLVGTGRSFIIEEDYSNNSRSCAFANVFS